MEERKSNKLGTMPMGKLLAQVSVPLMMSMMVQALYNIVDGIYVSQLSEAALTATTLATPIHMLTIAVATGTGVGINALLSRRLGEKRYDEANSAACNGFFLAVVSSLLFVIFGVFFCEGFMGLFSEDAELVQLAAEYQTICSTYCIFIFISLTGERLLQATGKSVLSMVSQMTGAVVNIILDPILIFGRFGMPAMGIRGAAVATVIGQACNAVVAITFNLLYNKDIKLSFKGFRPDLKSIKYIYRVGFPAILMQAIGSVMSVGMNKILITLSSTAVAVFGAYFRLQSFVFMPVFGLTQGMTPIIGFNYGARNPRRILSAIKLSVISALCIMMAGTALFNLAPELLLSLFEAEGEMLTMGIRAFRIISWIFPTAAVGIVFGSSFQGMGIGWISLANSVLRNLALLLPSAILLARISVDSVWFAFLIAEGVSLVVMVVMYIRVRRERIVPMLVETEKEVSHVSQ